MALLHRSGSGPLLPERVIVNTAEVMRFHARVMKEDREL